MQNKIALIIPSLGGNEAQHTGGAERVAVNICSGLASIGLRVDLVMFRASGAFLSEVGPDVGIVDLGIGNPFSIKTAVNATSLRLARYLRTARPSAVLCFDNRASIAAIIARGIARVDTRIVATVHNTLSLRWKASHPLVVRSLFPIILSLMYSKLDALITVSKGVQLDLATLVKLDRKKLHVVYNPVVGDQLLAKAGMPVGDPWLKKDGIPVILGVGRLIKAKDFPTLLRAFALVRQERRARLLILGEGEDRPGLEDLVRELGLQDDVSLPGFVENPYSYMAKADVYVLSSQWEGFALVLVEAMACGTPVVATDCPSGPHEILEGGRWGKLVPVGDARAMADAIQATLDAPLIPPPEAWARFTVAEIAQQYAALLLDRSESVNVWGKE